MRSLAKLIRNIIFVSLSFFTFPKYASADVGGSGWEGLVWLVFYLFTAIQIIVTVIYFILLKCLKKYDSARSLLHSIFAIVSLFYVYILAAHSYGNIFHLNNKGMISFGTYLFFIYYFLLVIFSFKWSQNHPKKTVISRTLTIIFLVLFFSWSLSPQIPPFTATKNYWSPRFGSGLWGAINVGHFIFNPITFPVLICLIIWVTYSANKLLYLPTRRTNIFLRNRRPFIQLILCAALIFGLIGLFEASISGPICRLFVYPKLLLPGSRGDSYEALRWSEYYRFKISKDDIISHPRYVNAFMCRANRRVIDGDYENALSDFMKVHDIYNNKGNQHYLRFHPLTYGVQVAWLYSTCPNDKIRDGVRAIELAKKAISLYGVEVTRIPVDQILKEQRKYTDWRKDPVKGAELLQVLAAAYAEAGYFADACNIQEKAYNILMAYNPMWFGKEKVLLTEQLERYRGNRAWREMLKSISRIYVVCH
jgi:tetratricopeptide (TPR) repeat protein